MIVWILFFVIILIAAFVLALRSMSDFKEKPSEAGAEYELYLIKKPENFDISLINYLYESIIEKNYLVSLERLFKGQRNALVIYGPKEVIQPLQGTLELVALEDYSHKVSHEKSLAAWEVGSKKKDGFSAIDFSGYIPQLKDTDDFWWQIVIRPVLSSQAHKQLIGQLMSKITKTESHTGSDTSDQTPQFQTVIRAVLQSGDAKSLQNLKAELVKIGNKEGMAMLPQAYTSSEILKQYQERSFPAGKFNPLSAKEPQLVMTRQDVLAMLGN